MESSCIIDLISLQFFYSTLKEPFKTNPTFDRIRILKESKKYKEAEDAILQELQKDPDQPLFKTSLADLYLRQGRLDEGRILVEDVLARDPQHPQALSVLGDIFLKQQSPREALECYRQAYSRDPRPYLTLKAARALKEMRKFDDALQELEKVLVVKPENLLFLKEKALILNRMKKFDQALETFEKIQGISPEDHFVQKEILRLRSLKRSEPQVLRELQAVAGMDSKKDDAQIHGLLAQKLRGAGLVKEATVEYQRASTLEPHNPYFLKQQGFCLYRDKKHDEAIHCLEQAFRMDPSDYVVRKTLEKSYEALGNLGKFLDLLEELYRQHPGQRPLLGTIKRVQKKLNLKSHKDS